MKSRNIKGNCGRRYHKLPDGREFATDEKGELIVPDVQIPSREKIVIFLMLGSLFPKDHKIQAD